MFNQLLDIYICNHPHLSSYCSYSMTCLLIEIFMGRLTPKNRPRIDDDDNTLQQVEDWIRINAYDRINIASLTENFNYSPSYLSTINKRQFGMGTTGQIRHIRIKGAQELLAEISRSSSQNAKASRYNDPRSLMRIFKRLSSLTPAKYRPSFSLRHYNNP